jgi:hypothetical protein
MLVTGKRISTEQWSNDTDGRNPVPGEKPILEPLWPPQIPYRLSWVLIQASVMRGWQTNCLGHGFRQPTWCHSKITHAIQRECNRLVIYLNFYKCRQSWVQYISKRFTLKQTHYQNMQKTSPCNIQYLKAIIPFILGTINITIKHKIQSVNHKTYTRSKYYSLC